VPHPDAATEVQTKAAETQATRAKYQASQRFERLLVGIIVAIILVERMH